MKTKKPPIAIVSRDPLIREELSEQLGLATYRDYSLKDISELEYHKTIPNKKNLAPLIFLDKSTLEGNEYNQIYKIMELRVRNPDALIVPIFPNNSLLNEHAIEVIQTTSNHPLLGPRKDSPPEEVDYLMFAHSLSERLPCILEDLNLQLQTPIAVYGGGRAGSEIVEGLLGTGLRIHWYSDHLAKEKGLTGYEEIAELKDFLSSGWHGCKSLDELVNSDAGLIIMASSQSRTTISKGHNRADGRNLRTLYEGAIKKTDRLIDAYQNSSNNALLGLFSNPPEALAERARIRGVPKEKILIFSPDNYRLRRRVHLEDATVLGFHHNPRILDGLRKKIGIEESEFLEKYLQEIGPRLLRIAMETGMDYEDAAHATTESVMDLLTFSRPRNIGYYMEDIGYFSMGCPPKIDYENLKLKPKNCKDCLHQESKTECKRIIKTIKKEKERVEKIIQTKSLA